MMVKDIQQQLLLWLFCVKILSYWRVGNAANICMLTSFRARKHCIPSPFFRLLVHVPKWLSFPWRFVIYAMWFHCFAIFFSTAFRITYSVIFIHSDKWERCWRCERMSEHTTNCIERRHKTFYRIVFVHFASFLLPDIVVL